MNNSYKDTLRMMNMDDKFEKIFPHVYRNKETGEVHTDIEPRPIE